MAYSIPAPMAQETYNGVAPIPQIAPPPMTDRTGRAALPTGGLDPAQASRQIHYNSNPGDNTSAPAVTVPTPETQPTATLPPEIQGQLDMKDMTEKFRNMDAQQVANIFSKAKSEAETAGLYRFFSGLGTQSAGYKNAHNYLGTHKFKGDQLEMNRFINYYNSYNNSLTPRFNALKGQFEYDHGGYNMDDMSYFHHAENYAKAGGNTGAYTRGIDGYNDLFTNKTQLSGANAALTQNVKMVDPWQSQSPLHFGAPAHGINPYTGQTSAPNGMSTPGNTGGGPVDKANKPLGTSSTPVIPVPAPTGSSSAGPAAQGVTPTVTAPAVTSTVNPAANNNPAFRYRHTGGWER
jgi:hypothetical protein